MNDMIKYIFIALYSRVDIEWWFKRIDKSHYIYTTVNLFRYVIKTFELKIDTICNTFELGFGTSMFILLFLY